MRTGKELLLASKTFACEIESKSWWELSITLFCLVISLSLTFAPVVPWAVRIITAGCTGLLYVRLFVIYHDYQHRAILQNSRLATWIMRAAGILLLAPEGIWKRSHEHHHNHNSKLTVSGIGSYPIVSRAHFSTLTKRQQYLYLINRHYLTIIFGYFTLFIYWLNVKSFTQSPAKHTDSLVALLLHVAIGYTVFYFFGTTTLLIAWCFPFFLAFAIGSYLFYCQHNFPGARFRENHDWKYDSAAIEATSFMKMNAVMQWFTANIGYHHIHHLNSRIPFYRLKEALDSMPELKNAPVTSWNPFEILRCFSLKLWDAELGRMITLKEFKCGASPSPKVSIKEVVVS